MVGCYGFGSQSEKELGQIPYPSIYFCTVYEVLVYILT